MLIACSSCNTKYLVNSADLKPDGRQVKCAICGKEWYQEANLNIDKTFSETSKLSEEKDSDLLTKKVSVANLPSTVVKESKTSILNSILVVFFVILLIFGFWLIKNYGSNIFVIISFYINEFFFNLDLIIKDFGKIINKIMN